MPIIFTGLRPGEKLHEDLFCGHEMPRPSAHELIRTVEVPPLSPTLVENIEDSGTAEEMLERLRAIALRIDEGTIDEIDLTAEEALRRASV